MDKKALSERDICTKFITPAIAKAGDGMQQGLSYADMLDVPFVFSSNGDGFLLHDRATNSTTGTAQPTVPLKPLREFKVPVAPLAEQHRIVAKVEHLMKLCDDLEAKLRRAEDRASKLVEAVVQEMVAP